MLYRLVSLTNVSCSKDKGAGSVQSQLLYVGEVFSSCSKCLEAVAYVMLMSAGRKADDSGIFFPDLQGGVISENPQKPACRFYVLVVVGVLGKWTDL